jgi:hypothetical protein
LFRFVLYAYAAGIVLVLLLLRGISTYDWATVPMLVEGTAYRPFVTRALVPTVVRTLVRATPVLEAKVEARVAGALARSGPGQRADRALDTLGWAPGTVYVHLVATLVMFVCFLLLPYVWRRMLLSTYDLPPPAADLAPVFALLVLPLFFVPYARYLYDPGTLLLWAVGLLLVIERRTWLVWGFLPVLAYHKETAVLLPLVVALRAPAAQSRVRTVLVLGAQLAVVAAVRLAVGRYYAGNPGDTVMLVGLAHTREIIVEFFQRPPYVPLVVAMLTALVVGGWRLAPVFLRRALFAVLGPLVLLGFVFGYVDEIRGYYEAYALVLLIALPGVLGWLGAGAARPRDPA